MSKSLLEAVAKAVLFARENSSAVLKRAVWDDGVYRIDLDAVDLPEKPFVHDLVDEHVMCKDLVEDILERSPDCRDDDMLLLLEVWKAQGVLIDLDRVELDVMFSAESITRARRRVQNFDGKFPPTTYAVAKRRGLNEELLREHYGKGE